MNGKAATKIVRIAASCDEVQTPVDTRKNRNGQTHYLPRSHTTSHLKNTRTDATGNIERKDKCTKPTGKRKQHNIPHPPKRKELPDV
ncbi:hypothetical protein LIER_11433 [Lithospermum erythrorhizon]|uniref:Uncharacterized protein n=1 Tax=Lithospermum erythrorhizon TaxID=34254 RepID=A0AAV3PN24_LITER